MVSIIRFFCLFILLLLLSCQTGEEPKGQRAPAPFFDLKTFFQNEIDRLRREQPRVKKTITINNRSEEKVLDTLDYSRELEVFLNSDINRTTWLDKYQVDSTFQAGQLAGLHYSALEEKLRTKEISIRFQEGEVMEITIENSTKSAIATSLQLLNYRPAAGYFIKTVQTVTLSRDQTTTVEVVFLDN